MNDEIEKSLFEATYNPDVLLCLANLSNDEVFTPPEVANQMIDMLPQELFEDPNTTFLDPCCKSGVFLREIAKRLIKGLEDKIPDLQERIDHIMHKQLYGIAITELTSLLSRRSLYCSKYPNSKYSISGFDDAEGNIRFKRINHTWKDKKCVYCGASKDQYDRDLDLETHAYELIHTLKPEEVFNMKFDVVIGNPPYQLTDGGGGGSAQPIYNNFVEQAKKLNPRYLTMIIPSRWFSGGRGLEEFRKNMLHDDRITNIVDFPISSECFPGVEIKGGVCYFLWERDTHDKCLIKTVNGEDSSELKRPLLEQNLDTFIRYNEAIPIFHKVQKFNEPSFDTLVSSSKPFGLRTFVSGNQEKTNKNSIILYGNKVKNYIDRNEIKSNQQWIDKYKVYITYAYGAGEDFPHQIINKPFLGEPGSACTETYLVVAPSDSKEECLNVISYMSTKFFRFMVLLLKNTQHATKSVYKLTPMQDFSKSWTDEELYKKYGLTEDEIAFIDSMIRPMELNNGGDE